jgi:hypothetical protein
MQQNCDTAHGIDTGQQAGYVQDGAMKFVMSFSGGMCSYFAARQLIDRHGTKDVTLLFADTLIEHHDLYRFLIDASADLGVPITRIADGRTPWGVFWDHHSMGNTRMDMCSEELKRDLLDRWCNENCDRRDTVRCVGLSYGERKRYVRFREKMRSKGWRVQAPAMGPMAATKADMMAFMRGRGLEPSDSYDEGFAHDNCGGFCIKQGQKGFINLLTKRPEVFAFHEAKEQEFRAHFGKDVSILRDRTGGTTKPLTLRVLRERVEQREIGKLNFCDEGAACGCAIDS